MLERFVEQVPLSTCVFTNGDDLCKAVAAGKLCDLYILDINLLPNGGIGVGEKLRRAQPPSQIIFMSSKQEYVSDLFKLHPLDFLLKPVIPEKLYSSICVAEKIMKRFVPYFVYTSKHVTYRIPYRDILYFESENKLVKIHTVSGVRTVSMQLADIKRSNSPPPTSFLQIHQSYLVNFDHTTWIKSRELGLDDGTKLSISYPYRKMVQAELGPMFLRLREEV